MKRFLKGIGIFLALVGVGVLSAFAVVALLLQQEEVKTPNLIGKDIVATIETINLQGLQLKIDGREAHATLPRDMVISQVPEPGSAIKKGRAVKVVVSLGPSQMQAPKIIGEQYRRAEINIRQMGYFPGETARVYSETVERDVVIAQDPPAGAPIEKAGRISMLVSAGKKPGRYVMPGLVGKKAEEAVRILDRMGLQHRTAYKAAHTTTQTTERLVISQKPAAGHPVTADASVELVVSK